MGTNAAIVKQTMHFPRGCLRMNFVWTTNICRNRLVLCRDGRGTETAKTDALLCHLNAAMRCRFRGRHSIFAPCRRLSQARCRKADCSAAASCNSPHASPAENSPLKSSTTVLSGGAPKARKTLLGEVPQHEKNASGAAPGEASKAQNITPVKGAKGNFGTYGKLSGKLDFGSVFCQINGRCLSFKRNVAKSMGAG